MRRFSSHLLLCALAALGAPAAARGQATDAALAERTRRMTPPVYDPSDASAPEVTRANLLENDRFWPYHVSLVEPFQPHAAAQPLVPATQGVLIRVESEDSARIDFGRDGVEQVPISSTDLLERANRKRLGEEHDFGPNLVVALAQRAVDASQSIPMKLGIQGGIQASGFLLVFADPDSLVHMAPMLAPLEGRHGVATLLLPQGRIPDPEMRDRLIALDWRVSYVYDVYAEAYARSLVEDGTPLPLLQLTTPDGKLLRQVVWSDDAPDVLATAIDADFAGN